MMILQKISGDFAICKVSEISNELLNRAFTFVSRTDHELSLICQTQFIPSNTTVVEEGWNCFRIAEDAAFEKYGMIAYLTKIIAAEKTGVLVVATYDTDYLFVKNEKIKQVSEALIKDGCQFMDNENVD